MMAAAGTTTAWISVLTGALAVLIEPMGAAPV